MTRGEITKSAGRVDLLRRLGPVGLLLAATLIFFLPYLFTGKTILPYDLLQQIPPWLAPDAAKPQNWMLSDVLVQYAPWHTLYRQALLAGEIPWWNPFSFSGMPFIANGQSGVFYPPNLLFLPLSLEDGVIAFLAFHQFLTGLGMFLLLRRQALSKAGAVAGAVAWMYTGFTTTWLLWLTISATLSWIPWSLLGVDWVMSTGKAKAVGGLGLIVALLLLAGHMQFAYYVFLIVGIYLGWRLLTATPAWLIGLKRTLWVGVGIGMGVGISLVQLVPTLELSGFNSRGALSIDELIGGAIPLRHLITLAVPHFFGGPNNYFGAGNFVEFNGYTGITVLLLGLLALAHGKTQRRSGLWFFLALAVLGLHLAYGGGLQRLLAFLPRYTEFRGLQRMACMGSFGIAGMAGWGVDALGLAQGRRRLLLLGTMLVVAAGGIWLAWQPVPALTWLVAQLHINPPGDWLPFVQPHWRWAWLFLTLAAGFVGLVLAVKPRLSPPILTVVLLIPGLLFAADLLHFSRGYLPVVDKSLAYPMTPGLAYLQSHADEGRIARYGVTTLGGPLSANMGMMYGISDIHGYDSFNLSQYGQLVGVIEPERRDYLAEYNTVGNFSKGAVFQSPILDMLHVAHMITLGPLADLPDAEQRRNNEPVGELLAGETIGQTFGVNFAGLYRVDIMLATFARTNQGSVIVRLRTSPTSGDLLAEMTLDVSQIADNSYVSLTFAPIVDSAGRSFYVEVQGVDGSPGNAITAWAETADLYPDGQLWHNGAPRNGDLRFRSFTSQNLFSEKWRLAYTGPDMTIYANRSVLPLAWLVGEVMPHTQPDAQLAALDDPGFDPRHQAVLDEVPATPIDPTASGAVTVRERTLNQLYLDVTVQAQPGEAGLLVISQNFYPGWRVEIDGAPASLLRTNYTLQGVVVPTGSHLIRLQFQPRYVMILGGLSLVLLCLTIGLGLATDGKRPNAHVSSGI